MCGIAGIIKKSNSVVTVSEVKLMTDLMAHRGPDDAGCFINNNFGLGHRRLSIIDISAAGHQPFVYQNIQIIFNGEIYNYIEIREELRQLGCVFNTETDTEVITAAYKQWGEACVNKFNGMWSFCIYDSDKEIFFCSRDRFGVKPFYYTDNGDQFLFASEIKALLPFVDNRKANRKNLLDYLVLGFEEHNEDTFFEGIKKLPASHSLIYDLKNHSFNINKYYTLQIHDDYKGLNIDDSVALFKDKLTDAVKLRLRSDVKVGSCLSGGLDSSSIVAIASGLYDHSEPFNAINAKSIDSGNDESSFAQTVTDYLGINKHVIVPGLDDFDNLIDDVIATQEEPFGSLSILMQYCVFKKAREINCTVMLDGQGGDEILLGYQKYYCSLFFSLPLWEKFKAIRALKLNGSLSLIGIIQTYLYFGFSSIRIRRLKHKFNFVKKEHLSHCSFDLVKKFSSKLKNIDELQQFELFNLQLPHLLKYEDKNSMRHSIESRLPLLDYRVVETALSLNNKFKIYNGWSKYPIRKAFEDILPAEIVWRKDKIGFAAPESLIINKNREKMLTQIKASNLLKQLLITVPDNLSARHLWRLYNICKWENAYNITL